MHKKELFVIEIEPDKYLKKFSELGVDENVTFGELKEKLSELEDTENSVKLTNIEFVGKGNIEIKDKWVVKRNLGKFKKKGRINCLCTIDHDYYGKLESDRKKRERKKESLKENKKKVEEKNLKIVREKVSMEDEVKELKLSNIELKNEIDVLKKKEEEREKEREEFKKKEEEREERLKKLEDEREEEKKKREMVRQKLIKISKELLEVASELI